MNIENVSDRSHNHSCEIFIFEFDDKKMRITRLLQVEVVFEKATLSYIKAFTGFKIVEALTGRTDIYISRGARWSKWTPRAIFGCPVVF